tara:strand:+ start:6622 stop:7359 length:738 start_codon:yes stop_codon:yes gene_type:complete
VLSIFLDKFSDEINGIIHVGAHTGEEIEQYIKYKNKIVLFEPQKDIYKKLLENVKNLNNVECFNFGLGSKDEIKTLYKSQGNYGKSSSVLSPKLHLEVQPNISFIEDQKIEIKRFDNLQVEALNFLTIDVQGFELEVLKGFGKKLEKVDFVFTEINTKFLYENNALVGDIDKYLKKFDLIRIYTNVDCFNYFGDAFYIKKSNKNFSNTIFNKSINRIKVSNSFLGFKKLFYPKRLIKKILNYFKD